jgi:hypothetical protein
MSQGSIPMTIDNTIDSFGHIWRVIMTSETLIDPTTGETAAVQIDHAQRVIWVQAEAPVPMQIIGAAKAVNLVCCETAMANPFYHQLPSVD